MCISFIYAIFSDAFNSSDHIVLNGVMISEERWKVSGKKPSSLSSCQDSMKKPQSK